MVHWIPPSVFGEAGGGAAFDESGKSVPIVVTRPKPDWNSKDLCCGDCRSKNVKIVRETFNHLSGHHEAEVLCNVCYETSRYSLG